MASIVERPKKDGTTTYQVKWRQDGEWQSEKFGDPDGAKQFKDLVEAHGGQWPHGWVRGEGFVEETAIPGDMPFETWAARYIDRLTGIEERTREDYRRDLRIHLSLLRHTSAAGREHPATIGNLTQDDISDWVRAEEKGEPDPEKPDAWLRRPSRPEEHREPPRLAVLHRAGRDRRDTPDPYYELLQEDSATPCRRSCRGGDDVSGAGRVPADCCRDHRPGRASPR